MDQDEQIIDLDAVRRRVEASRAATDNVAHSAAQTPNEAAFAALARDAQANAAQLVALLDRAQTLADRAVAEAGEWRALASDWAARDAAADVARRADGLEAQVVGLLAAHAEALQRIEARQLEQTAKIDALAAQQAEQSAPFWVRHPIATGIAAGVVVVGGVYALRAVLSHRARLDDLQASKARMERQLVGSQAQVQSLWHALAGEQSRPLRTHNESHQHQHDHYDQRRITEQHHHRYDQRAYHTHHHDQRRVTERHQHTYTPERVIERETVRVVQLPGHERVVERHHRPIIEVRPTERTIERTVERVPAPAPAAAPAPVSSARPLGANADVLADIFGRESA